ncbi:MAG: phosphoribosylamine--glycine ligase [Vicingaceae bacterium]|jgi:phosphoribosylamine--glycine ligase
MNILILGSGGREHAIAWKLKQSPKTSNLFIAPGNAGTTSVGTNLNIGVSDFDAIADCVREHHIRMIVVGPEAPLVEGIVDYFRLKPEFSNVRIIGPAKYGAQLEGSKEFAKEFMMRNQVPTARFKSFTSYTLAEGYSFLDSLKPPYVLKADGLAGGKGVLILNDLDEAKSELKLMLVDAKFGAASSNVVIEEYLDGIEMSVFVLTDGVNYQILPEAKDYKRIGEGDTGLNTGGMGAVSPVPFMNDQLKERIKNRVVEPSVNGLNKEKIDYKGFLFIGLMIVDNEPFVIEYNVRMGDPETEVVMPRIKSDLVEHLIACADGKLNTSEVEFEKNAATTVMLVAQGYPEAYEKGKEMTGFDYLGDCLAFHAGTKELDGKVLTDGGRILAISALGENFKDALEKSFRNADRILYEGKYYRKDIGFDLMEY